MDYSSNEAVKSLILRALVMYYGGDIKAAREVLERFEDDRKEVNSMDIDKISSPEHETAPPPEADPVIQQETRPHPDQED